MLDRKGGFWERTLPDIHGRNDMEYFIRKSKDPAFQFGADFKATKDLDARILSIKPEDLGDINKRLRDARRSHVTTFIFGTYNLSKKSFRMNDTGIPSELVATAIVYMPLAVALIPSIIFLRSLYFFGRRGWWRHEATHARHHYNMTQFLRAKGEGEHEDRAYENLEEKAGLTIHESGLEELVTRWQSLREARGPREKLAAGVSLLFYLEYSPFMGVRNFYNDLKEKIHRGLKDAPAARFIGKANLIAYSMAYPIIFALTQADDAAKYIHNLEPLIPEGALNQIIFRGGLLFAAGVAGAAISPHLKGALSKKLDRVDTDKDYLGVREGEYTKDYKFPFTYNPIKSFWRSIKLVRYLGKVWDAIPNYKRITTSSDLNHLRYEIRQKLQAKKLSEQQRQFTMNSLNDILGTVRPQANNPQDVYLKGQFLSAVYLRAKELFEPQAKTL